MRRRTRRPQTRGTSPRPQDTLSEKYVVSFCGESCDLSQFLPALREQTGIAAVVYLHLAAYHVCEQQILGSDRHWKSSRRILTEDLYFISEIPAEYLIDSDAIQRTVVKFIVRRWNESFGEDGRHDYGFRTLVFFGDRRMAVQADSLNPRRGQQTRAQG